MSKASQGGTTNLNAQPRSTNKQPMQPVLGVWGRCGQVEVMLAFVRKAGLMDELHARDWRGFARRYNGPGQVDHYARLMKAAYKRHAGDNWQPSATPDGVLRVGARGDAVADLQRRLRGQGYHMIVDGDFGPATLKMVKQFQSDHDLVADGIAGPATLGVLEARFSWK